VPLSSNLHSRLSISESDWQCVRSNSADASSLLYQFSASGGNSSQEELMSRRRAQEFGGLGNSVQANGSILFKAQPRPQAEEAHGDANTDSSVNHMHTMNVQDRSSLAALTHSDCPAGSFAYSPVAALRHVFSSAFAAPSNLPLAASCISARN